MKTYTYEEYLKEFTAPEKPKDIWDTDDPYEFGKALADESLRIIEEALGMDEN